MALITFSSNSTAIALKAAVFGAATRQAECDLAVAGVGTGFIVKLYLGAAVRGTVTSLAPFTVGGSTDRRLIWPTFGPYAATGAPFGIVDTAEILTSAGVSLWKMPLVMGVVQDGCKPDFGPYPIVLGNPAKPIGAGNSAPTITSGATFQIYENATAIATMTATDDATGLVWSISPQVGGSNANAALFTITSGGILSFIAGQAAAVRLVRVRVTDAGGLFAEKDLTITVAVYTGSVFPIAALGSASAKSTPYTQTQLANNMGGFWQPDSITPSVVSTIAGPRVMIDAAAVTRAQAVAVAGIDARWVQLESVADAEVAMGATVLFGKSTYDNTGSWRRAQLCAAAYLAHPNASKRAAYLARVETVLAAFALSYKTSINVADGPLLAWGDTTTSTPLPGGGFCVVKDQRNIPFSDESQGYGYRDTIPILCVMLDWCYAGLSVPTRDKISALLMDWFEHMCVPAWYPAWNRNQYINWCMWPVAYFNNYWWANYGSMAMMVCAAYGRDPRTDSPNGTNRPAWGKDWIEKTWNGLMEPWFARGDGVGGKGGAASYATAYEQSSHISAIRIGWKNTFGDTTTIPATWFNEHLNWQIQRIMPGMTKRAKLGEDKRSDSFGNQQQFNWHRLLVTIHAADDATQIGRAHV